MTKTALPPEWGLVIERELHVAAPMETTFEVLLEEVGSEMCTPDGSKLAMKLEARPGGRWFRDLGDEDGHLWGHVQAIKRPSLLELCGPLFMSSPTSNNVQYRLEPDGDGTRIRFVHTAFGPLDESLRDGMPEGWDVMFERVTKRAESRA